MYKSHLYCLQLFKNVGFHIVHFWKIRHGWNNYFGEFEHHGKLRYTQITCQTPNQLSRRTMAESLKLIQVDDNVDSICYRHTNNMTELDKP